MAIRVLPAEYPEIPDDMSLNEYAGEARAHALGELGFECFQQLQTILSDPTLSVLFNDGGLGLLTKLRLKGLDNLSIENYAANVPDERTKRQFDGAKQLAEHIETLLADAKYKKMMTEAETADPKDDGAPKYCSQILRKLDSELNYIKEVAVKETSEGDDELKMYLSTDPRYRVTRNGIQQAVYNNIQKALRNFPPLSDEPPFKKGKRIVTLKQYLALLEEAADKYARKAKRVMGAARKGHGLSTAEQNRNKLCVASVPFAALQSAMFSAPQLIRSAVKWQSQGDTDLEIRLQQILQSNPASAGYTDNPWLFGGLTARVLTEWIGKYVNAATRPANNFANVVPGFHQFIAPTLAELKTHRMYWGATFPGVLASRPEITAISSEGAAYVNNILLKGADLESQVLLSAMYAMPTPNVISTNGESAVDPRNMPERFFNNAMTKPRFKALDKGRGANPTCNTLARLLDMGDDSCPTLKKMSPVLANQKQTYPIEIQASEGASRVGLTFNKGAVTVNVSLNEPKAGGSRPRQGVLWPTVADAINPVGVRYQLNRTMNLKSSDFNSFAKAGAAGLMATRVVEGLTTGMKTPARPVTSSIPAPGRYALYLNNPVWMGKVVSAALQKWVGDYSRLIETFVQYTLPSGKVKSSALLANNDRPAQAAAILMTTAKGRELTPSACYYASDLNNIKKDLEIIKLDAEIKQARGNKAKIQKLNDKRTKALGKMVFGAWALSPEAIRQNQYITNAAHISPFVTTRGAPHAGQNAPPGSSVSTLLLSAADTLHDMTPSAGHMAEMAKALSKMLSGMAGGSKRRVINRRRGRRRVQRGGVRDELKQQVLIRKVRELIATEAMMALADRFLAANGSETGIGEYVQVSANTYISIQDYDTFEENRILRYVKATEDGDMVVITERGHYDPITEEQIQSIEETLANDHSRILVSQEEPVEREFLSQLVGSLGEVIDDRLFANTYYRSHEDQQDFAHLPIDSEESESREDNENMPGYVVTIMTIITQHDSVWFEQLRDWVRQLGEIGMELLAEQPADGLRATQAKAQEWQSNWQTFVGETMAPVELPEDAVIPESDAPPLAEIPASPEPVTQPRVGLGRGRVFRTPSASSREGTTSPPPTLPGSPSAGSGEELDIFRAQQEMAAERARREVSMSSPPEVLAAPQRAVTRWSTPRGRSGIRAMSPGIEGRFYLHKKRGEHDPVERREVRQKGDIARRKSKRQDTWRGPRKMDARVQPPSPNPLGFLGFGGGGKRRRRTQRKSKTKRTGKKRRTAIPKRQHRRRTQRKTRKQEKRK